MSNIQEHNIDVLVTCGRYTHQMVCCLAEAGLRVWVTDCIPSAVKYSKYIKGYTITPDYTIDENDYIDKLLELIDAVNPKVLIPVFDAKLISRHIHEFPETIIIPVDDYKVIELLDNKKNFLAFAQKIGVPMPEFILSANEINEYPVVVKFPYGRSGSGVKIINSSVQLDTLIDQLDENDYFITKFIKGVDYSIDCVRWDGFFQSSVYRSIQSSESQSGPSVYREIVIKDDISDYAARILDELHFKGVCGFDFRVDENGQAFLLEANPRYTGGLGTHLASGFNIPVLQYKLAIGEKPAMSNIAIGASTKSFWGALGTAFQNICNDSIFDYNIKNDINFRTDNFEDIKMKDIMPFFYQIFINRRRIFTVLLYYLFKIKL